jgi:hypothetical protein
MKGHFNCFLFLRCFMVWFLVSVPVVVASGGVSMNLPLVLYVVITVLVLTPPEVATLIVELRLVVTTRNYLVFLVRLLFMSALLIYLSIWHEMDWLVETVLVLRYRNSTTMSDLLKYESEAPAAFDVMGQMRKISHLA